MCYPSSWLAVQVPAHKQSIVNSLKIRHHVVCKCHDISKNCLELCCRAEFLLASKFESVLWGLCRVTSARFTSRSSTETTSRMPLRQVLYSICQAWYKESAKYAASTFMGLPNLVPSFLTRATATCTMHVWNNCNACMLLRWNWHMLTCSPNNHLFWSLPTHGFQVIVVIKASYVEI